MRCYSLINPVAGQITGTALLGGSAAGNAYQEKINLGYSDDEARAYGYMVGASEAVLEYAIGGVSKLDAAKKRGLPRLRSRLAMTERRGRAWICWRVSK